MLKVDDLKFSEVMQLMQELDSYKTNIPKMGTGMAHPMLNRRCLIRTYSAGVHIGDVVFVDGMEVKLENALRLWKWEDGGLSLSAVANNGINKGRLNRTGEVYLTNVIEIIPTNPAAEATYIKWIEDDK